MPVLTSIIGKNEDLIPEILKIYTNKDMTIADVTYGNGNFWKRVDTNAFYAFLPSDIKTNGVDFRELPYPNNCINVLVFDPPYMHGSPAKLRKDLDKTYRNNDKGGWGTDYVYNLYLEGMEEAYRVLVDGGLLWVKCQDQVSSGKNRFDHIVIYDMALELGFLAEDLFILTRTGTPMMRHSYQKHARKNHSYMWIFRKA